MPVAAAPLREPVPEPEPVVQLGVEDDPLVLIEAGWADVPWPPAPACAPQWLTLPFWPSDPAVAWPVEMLAFWDELPAETDAGWVFTEPGGGLGGGFAATAAVANESSIADARTEAAVADLDTSVPPVCRVATQ